MNKNIPPAFQCPRCHFLFWTWEMYALHMKKHQVEDMRKKIDEEELHRNRVEQQVWNH